MNNWWKAGLLGAAALGATALTGGLGAGLIPGLLGGAGEGTAAAAGGGALGTAGGLGTAAAETATAAAPEAAAATTAAAATPTAFVSAPVVAPWASAGETSGLLAGTDAGYGTAASNSLLASGGAATGGTGAASGTLAGTELGYGTGSLAGGAPLIPSAQMATATPTAMQQAMGYAKMGGKAASAYSLANQAIGGAQQHMAPPAPQPIFQGPAPQISQPMAGMGGNQNAFLQLLMQQRQRGMLG